MSKFTLAIDDTFTANKPSERYDPGFYTLIKKSQSIGRFRARGCLIIDLRYRNKVLPLANRSARIWVGVKKIHEGFKGLEN